jgi:hypothetical protein
VDHQAHQLGAVVPRKSLEAQAVSALDHPNTCPIYEIGKHENQPHCHPIAGWPDASAFIGSKPLSSKPCWI